ncbi:tetratricopeptide repeat protein [Amycolatopsis sp. CA-128772]|uniref:tetratricopeptide repeat protein n=1 Tax=Amycolatopsis sp. CA-128772 TaxID=2073159 RepID=UPI000CD206E8|nr:tetratricopeptide repeat protein [Amycolatopsis sp. CA-128772]
MLAGLPPPLHPPDRPLPDELAGASAHGYNCRCVAAHFGLDPASYGVLAACSLTEAEYEGLLGEALEAQGVAKRLAGARDVVGAHREYGRMRQLAQRLDRIDLELAAVSDLATVCYSAGDPGNARQCAETVLAAFRVGTAAAVHFGQYAELRMMEGSREVADRVLVSLATEDGDVVRARELIAGQRHRAAARKAAGPGQYPRRLLDPHGADELTLRILEARVQVAAGDPAGALVSLEEILAALEPLVDVGEVRDQAASLQAMACAERARLRQAGGEDADARADLVRLTARHEGRPAAAKFAVDLAADRALGGDFAGAVTAIVTARDELAAAGVTGDVAEASFALGSLLFFAGDPRQAREQFEHAGEIWRANGDTPGRRRFDVALARCAAAEGGWATAEEHLTRARESARASGDWLQCLHTDFVAAELGFARGEDLRAVLDLLLPVALAAADYRFAFASPRARTAWARDVAGPAAELLMALLARLEEPRLAAELIERTCAVGAYTGAGAPALDLTGELPAPEPAPPAAGLPLAALGTVTASLPLRLAPPPALRWSPGSPMELDRWLDVAAERYGSSRPATAPVTTWPDAGFARETFLLRYADAGHTYLSWRTTADLDTVHTHPVDAVLVATAREFLAAASPTPCEGESAADAVRRSLGDGAFGSFAGEQRLARALALNLLPADLVTRLRAAAAGGRRPLLRVQPSPSLAAVPWGLLALPDRRPERGLEPGEEGTCFDGDERVLDVADVSLLAPAGIPRRPPAPPGPPVYVLDPRIPGQSAFGELGSVLGRQEPASPLIRHLDAQLAAGPVRPSAARGLDLVRRTDTDRRLLGRLLAEPCSRLVFAGHVSQVRDDHGAQTALHLSCPAGLPGTAEPIGAHRPFTAADLALSPVAAMPARVALIGCASASDFGLPEPFGVLLAAVAAGARLVAATVWALPTSAAVPGADPMAELVIAVDTALAGDDPVTDLCAWQRRRLARWRDRPGPAGSPAFWAAVTCLDATDDGQTWVR